MSNQLYPTLLLFGVPGVGKGTQGTLLGEIDGFFHVSSGDIFRSLDPNSPDGREVNDYTARGALVPDELTLRLWKKWLDRQIAESRYNPANELLLLDGIPRNAPQCESLQHHIQVLKIIHLACSDDQAMIDRIKKRALEQNRDDDEDEDIIRHRFEVYRNETAPILEFYPSELIATIDPFGTPAEVLKRIMECVMPLMNR